MNIPIRREGGQSVEDMAQQMAAAPRNKMYRVDDGNKSSERIAALTNQAIEIIQARFPSRCDEEQQVLKTGRIDLSDPEEIKETAVRYLKACAASGLVPTFASFSAACGYSRKYVWQVMTTRKSAGTEMLDFVSGLFASLIEQAALVRAVDAAAGIFGLKNSLQGYSDRIDINASASRVEPFETGDPEEIAKRYLSGIPGNYGKETE